MKNYTALTLVAVITVFLLLIGFWNFVIVPLLDMVIDAGERQRAELRAQSHRRLQDGADEYERRRRV